MTVHYDEGEEGHGGVQADVGDDSAALAVEDHEAPRRRSQVLQDLKGQRAQEQEVGHQQVEQVNAGAPLFLRHEQT